MTTNLRKLTSTKRGETIETSMTDAEARDILRDKAAPNDTFASDLVRKFAKLSQEQIFWLHKKALAIAKPKPATGINVGDFKRIHTMFHAAAQHLARPKIRLMDDEGHQLRLSLAPATGKNPGCIYVKDEHANYLGKVTADGVYSPSKTVPATVVSYLRQFAADPETIAAKYGKLTGNCCFCARSLTDERSTDVGYGPICADRYNLAWGARKSKN